MTSESHPSERLQQLFAAGLAELHAVLAPHGFVTTAVDDGVSSGGAFTRVAFVRDGLAIEVIMRGSGALGCPNYTDGQGYVGHTNLLEALGVAPSARLVTRDGWTYVDGDGGSPFTALAKDLSHLILPRCLESPGALSAACAQARDRLKAVRGW